MNKTIYIDSGKLSDTSFFIDVLYYSATSYSKSLYPTLTRLFNKYSIQYLGGGTYSSIEMKLAVPCQKSNETYPPYYIKRTIYTLK